MAATSGPLWPPPSHPNSRCPPILHFYHFPPQSNTPRTLQEILPALIAEIIDALADDGEYSARAWCHRSGLCAVCTPVGTWRMMNNFNCNNPTALAERRMQTHNLTLFLTPKPGPRCL